MEVTGNIVHPHLQLNRNSIPSPPFVVHPCPNFVTSASHVFLVYRFSCDLCDADYVGYTARHLHRRIAEHKNSAIGRHSVEAYGSKNLLTESQLRILRNRQGKFDCLVFEILFIEQLKPNINIQTDSIRAKRFVQLVTSSFVTVS